MKWSPWPKWSIVEFLPEPSTYQLIFIIFIMTTSVFQLKCGIKVCINLSHYFT